MMFFKNANPYAKGTHEYYLEEIRRLTDVNELVGGMNADVDYIMKKRQDATALQQQDETNHSTTNNHETKSAAAASTPTPSTPVLEQQYSSSEESMLTSEQSDMFLGRLARLKDLLYDHESQGSGGDGGGGSGGTSTAYAVQTAQVFIQKYPTFFPRVLRLMPTPSVPFEARKHITAIFTVLLTGNATKEVFGSHYMYQYYNELMSPICAGFDCQKQSPDTALLCGNMYRATLRNPILYRTLLDSPDLNSQNAAAAKTEDEQQSTSSSSSSCHEKYLYPLLEKCVFVPDFDSASDALTTLREVFTNDKKIAAEYLNRDYDNVFRKYNQILQHDSYVTKRMSLKLLGEMLLERSNFHVMIKYISNRDNLRIIMLLLRDSSANIQFEAFHVFKIFVANPNKPPEIVKILVQNKIKLVAYLEQFHRDKEDGDEQFRDEKALLINTLNGLVEGS